MITGRRCSGDQRRVLVWLVGDQVLFLFEDTTTGLNWSGRAKDGTTHDDPYYKFVYCLPPPCGMKYFTPSQKTHNCAQRCVSCAAFSRIRQACSRKLWVIKSTELQNSSHHLSKSWISIRSLRPSAASNTGKTRIGTSQRSSIFSGDHSPAVCVCVWYDVVFFNTLQFQICRSSCAKDDDDQECE